MRGEGVQRKVWLGFPSECEGWDGGEKQWRCLVFLGSCLLEATRQLLVSSDGVGGYLQDGWGHKDDVEGKHNHVY